MKKLFCWLFIVWGAVMIFIMQDTLNKLREINRTLDRINITIDSIP